MDKLLVLGTGTASVTKCYNTCFALQKDDEYFLVDGGGDSQIFTVLNKVDIPLTSIHHVFISHNHIDHIIGILWLIRKFSVMFWAGDNSYQDNLDVYASAVTINAINTICKLTLEPELYLHVGKRIKLNIVKDREVKKILNEDVMFFDILSQKDTQFGFKTLNSKIIFTGDDICREPNYDLVKNSNWLLHEAFCKYQDRDIFKPYEKGHFTVKEASELAEKLNVKNLILWHSEDKTIENRKKQYSEEAKQYFNGNVIVPNDLEIIALK